MAAIKKWAVCKCFYERNIFLPFLGHIKFQNKEQFLQDYSSQLEGKNSTKILETVTDEIKRRLSIHPNMVANRERIKEVYQLIYPILFEPKDVILDLFTKDDLKLELSGVYSFPLLSEPLCNKILEEISNFKKQDGLTHQRPNSMNKNGILLEELGLDSLIEKIVKHVEPLAKKFFPALVASKGFDSFKAFTVEYNGDGNAVNPDLELNTHFDNSEVTLNIPLTKDYDGSELYFQYQNGFRSLSMEVGRGILHSGRLLHGVFPIEEGYRHNIIIWMRSSEIRNRLCPMCNDVQVLEGVEGTTGDGFTIQ